MLHIQQPRQTRLLSLAIADSSALGRERQSRTRRYSLTVCHQSRRETAHSCGQTWNVRLHKRIRYSSDHPKVKGFGQPASVADGERLTLPADAPGSRAANDAVVGKVEIILWIFDERIKDIGVWTFYAQERERHRYHPVRHTTVDFRRFEVW
jgi:hypothetical protein